MFKLLVSGQGCSADGTAAIANPLSDLINKMMFSGPQTNQMNRPHMMNQPQMKNQPQFNPFESMNQLSYQVLQSPIPEQKKGIFVNKIKIKRYSLLEQSIHVALMTNNIDYLIETITKNNMSIEILNNLLNSICINASIDDSKLDINKVCQFVELLIKKGATKIDDVLYSLSLAVTGRYEFGWKTRCDHNNVIQLINILLKKGATNMMMNIVLKEIILGCTCIPWDKINYDIVDVFVKNGAIILDPFEISQTTGFFIHDAKSFTTYKEKYDEYLQTRNKNHRIILHAHAEYQEYLQRKSKNISKL